MVRLEGFLQKVVPVKQAEVKQAGQRISLATLRADAEATPPPVSFLAAMEKSSPEDVGIIAEVKKASPSKGDIRPDLDPAAMAALYHEGGARAISVLTESRYFKGNLADLETVCETTRCPVLRKDFTISSYQIYEAKRAGAASILLITTLLSRDQLSDYISLVRELGMEPLVEITSELEFETAYRASARVVDINNRNLSTLEVDQGVSKRISTILPGDVIGVEASGISGRSDIEKGVEAGFSNFLVGESIVRASDTAAFIKRLREA